MDIFLQGLTMGLAYVAPIGLQNMFVINAALTQKRPRAYLTALIIVFFDVTLALACFFGVGALMEQAKWLEMVILLAGSLIVLWIGVGLLRTKTTLDRTAQAALPWAKVLSTACVVTWFNPQAIIDGSMMLGAFRASLPPETAYLFIIGVAVASCLWFLGLTTFLSLFSHKFNDKILRGVNIVCGAVVIFYGIKLLISFFTML